MLVTAGYALARDRAISIPAYAVLTTGGRPRPERSRIPAARAGGAIEVWSLPER